MTLTKNHTTVLPKEQKMITSAFRITIHLSELGLLLIDSVFAFLYTFDFLSTVHGDYGKGKIENLLFVYENVKYRISPLLSNLFY